MTVFASGFSWYQLLPGVGDGSLGHTLGLATPHDAWVIPAAWAGAFVILGVALLARMGLESALKKDGPERFIPDSGFTGTLATSKCRKAISDWNPSITGRPARITVPAVAGCDVRILSDHL